MKCMQDRQHSILTGIKTYCFQKKLLTHVSKDILDNMQR